MTAIANLCQFEAELKSRSSLLRRKFNEALGSITSRCSENEPALIGPGRRRKSSLTKHELHRKHQGHAVRAASPSSSSSSLFRTIQVDTV